MGDGADTATNLLLADDLLHAGRRAAAGARDAAAGETGSGAGFEPFGADGLSFRDLLDIVNPLQHIPIVSTIYRKLTGDTIDPAARVAGGALFGGAIGAAVSAVNALVAEATGRDIGDHVTALVTGEDAGGDTVQIAGDVPAEAPGHADRIVWATPAARSPAPPPDGLGDTIVWTSTDATPPGSTAPLGGWFTDTMLSALTKYEHAARLSGVSSPSIDTIK